MSAQAPQRIGFPVSIILFVITLLLLVLQLIPVVGVFLMIMAVPSWSILLVNGGFIGIAIEALVRRSSIHPAWLIAPILWFGGYGTYYLVQEVHLFLQRASVAEHNEGVEISFDPEVHSLVVDGLDIQPLYAGYGLAAVYLQNDNYAGFSHMSYRLAPRQLCQDIMDNSALYGSVGVSVFGLRRAVEAFDPNNAYEYETRPCELRMPEDPPPGTAVAVDYHFERDATVEEYAGVSATAISMPNGSSYTLRGGRASRLASWFPRLVIGCGLNSSNPSWDCFGGFLRTSRDGELATVNDEPVSETQLLAAVLGLHPLLYENWQIEDAYVLREIIDDHLRRHRSEGSQKGGER